MISSQGVLQFNEDARKELLTANGDSTVGVFQHLLANRSNSRVEWVGPDLDAESEGLDYVSARHRASRSIKHESDN